MNKYNELGARKLTPERTITEILAILFKDSTKSFMLSIGVSVLLMVMLKDSISTNMSTIWALVLLAAYLLRQTLAYQYAKQEFKLVQPSTWLNRFRLSSAFCGLAWGSAALLMFPTHQTTNQALLAFVLGGVCAGALINYSIDKVSSMAFVGSVLLLTVTAYIGEYDQLSTIILTLTVLFVAYVAYVCRRLAAGILSNIVLRLNAEDQQKQILKLSQRQHLHLAHTPLGVIEWDEHLTITAWNKACTEMLGYTLDEAIGMHISFIMPELINKPTTHVLHLISKDGHDKTSLKEITHKNGNKVDCEWFNTVLNDEEGNFIGIASLVQDKTEFLKTQDKIHQLAYYDPLTKLPNRSLLLDRLNHTLEVSDRADTYAMVAFLDLDHFKAINDIKGHAAGDYLLTTIATRIQSVIRKQDTVARIGGDEFVLVLADVGATKKKALAYSEEIIKKVSNAIKLPLEYDGYQHQCSASIGICLFKGNAMGAEELLKRSDMSMYLAKKQGRNCYQFYDETMQQKYDYQLQLKHDLSTALEQGQFELYLQGQFNRDAQSIGAEVLLRWQHPTLGLIMPTDFIPLAEETGLIVPIGHWVMKESCKLLKKWESSPDTKSMTLSVNVSAIQFNEPDFISQVKTAIQAARCNATKLCIELTESAVINSIEDLPHKMNLLKAMGVSLAIDDFGVGYSSLSTLKNLPLNTLKIDKSFMQNITTGSVESSILQTILQLGEKLNLRIVAEGVESEHQLACLKNYGCNIFQGFFFETPCPVQAFESNVTTRTVALNTMLALSQPVSNANELRH